MTAISPTKTLCRGIALALSLAGFAEAAVEATSTVDLKNTIVDAVPTVRSGRIAFSPDGGHVYAVNEGIYVHERDPVSGDLTFVEVEGTLTASTVAVAPDGLHVYAKASIGSLLHIYARDPASGALTFVATQNALNIHFVLFSPDGAYVYMLRGPNETAGSGIRVYARDSGTGLLTAIEVEAGGADVASAVLSPGGEHLYVAEIWSGLDTVKVFSRDPATGELAALPAMTLELEGARRLVPSPDGAHMYVYQASSGTRLLHTYARDGVTGALTLVESDSYLDVVGVLGLHISSDGAHAYTTIEATTEPYYRVRILERDPTAGELSPAGEFGTQIEPGGIALAPDGAHAYAQASPALKTYARDAGTGALTFAGAKVSLHGARGAILSPDGAHAYLWFGESWIVVAARNAGNGDLSPIQTLFEGVDGVAGLFEVSDLAISGDGAHVYATAEAGNALGVFERDPSTGELSFVEVKRNGVDGVAGLAAPNAVTVSTDGEYVYAGSYDGDGLVVFARDAVTGTLTFVENEIASLVESIVDCSGDDHVYLGAGWLVAYSRDPVTGELDHLAGYNPFNGGFGSSGVTVIDSAVCSPDGKNVYAVGDGPSPVPTTLLSYSRDPSTGELDLIQVSRNEAGGFFDLGRDSLAISADGQYVYATDPLTVFRRDPATGLVAFVESDGVETDLETEVVPSPDGDVYRIGFETIAADVWERGFSCTPQPDTACATGDAAKLDVVDSLLDQKDKVAFQLTKVGATSPSQFDPGTSNHFALCFYDESGSPELVLGALAPANQDCRQSSTAPPKPCWKTGSVSKLKDSFATPDGLRDLTLKPGAPGKVAIKASIRAPHLKRPDLPFGLPLRVQLQAASGLCWDVVFPSADINEAGRFKAKVAN